MRKQRNIARLFILTLALASLMSSVTLISSRLASAQSIGGTWAATGSLNMRRYMHTATLLPNGKVLAAGGGDYNCSPFCRTSFHNSAELYDPATETWSYTGSLNNVRFGHQALLLSNNQVLVTGGFYADNDFVDFTYLKSAELYDPATGNWRPTGSFTTIQGFNSATLLPNGKVLAIGSSNPNAFDTAELYDPTSGTWSLTGAPRSGRIITLLPNGKVLAVWGGSAELYDPTTEIWSSTNNPNLIGFAYTATLLQNGKVLITGAGASGLILAAELYDPATGTWSSTGAPSVGGRMVLLSNGKVLAVSGNSAELYDPTAGQWSTTGPLNTPRLGTMTLLPDRRVLVAGGDNGDYDWFIVFNSAELYTPPATPNPNQIDDAQFFVRQHYRDFLNREPDADGLAFWTNEIVSCGGDVQCIDVKRINVSAAYFLSIEFQQTGYLVYRFYKASYGNVPGAPVPVRLSEFLPDTQQLGQGVVVNQAGWEQILESNKQAFATEFVQRSRFVSTYPTSMSSEQFVDALFANAGVTPSETDRAAAINEFPFAASTADVAARARALRRVAENLTLAQQEFNRAFVLMQYFGYLRRNPNDPPEGTLDFQGYNFWLTKLNQFNGNFVQAEMVKAFLVSTEYRQRFGQP